jgi:DNA-binding GntR family transcriptional regulator
MPPRSASLSRHAPEPLFRGQDAAPATTLTDSVWSRLRADILSGGLAPGSRVTIEFLKNRYGAGASPIREALWRLSAEGLVKSSSHRGFEIMAVFRDELVDIIRLRIMLEQQALEESVAAGTVAWEAEILSCFHRLSKHRQADGQEWDYWHSRFHDALVAGCHAPVLQQMRRQLFDLSSRYRNLTRSLTNRDDLEEHRALMEACLARDLYRAKKLIADHFELTGQLVLSMFEQ